MKTKKEYKESRKLFVIDIENAIGNGRVNVESCQKVRSRIEAEYVPSNSDLTVIGVSHSANVFPAASWSGARVVCQNGHNGADLALERVLSKENVEARFDEVIIVSGDGLFGKQAARLRALGVKVTVDSYARGLSRFLALSCSRVRFAPELPAA